MNREKQFQIMLPYFGFGFLSGLIVLLIIYGVLLSALQLSVSIQTIQLLHNKSIFLYLLDSIPVVTMLFALMLGEIRWRKIKELDQVQSIEKEDTALVRKAIQQLTIGNYSAKVPENILDEEISDSLKLLQQKLLENKQVDLSTRREEKKRNWTTEGLAEFGDILRTNTDDIKTLSYAVISKLVNYLDVNQGGFFVIEDREEDRVLKMVACHAYSRNKFPDKEMLWGDGLIGAVALEKKSYYTNKIPDGYLTITSGLGKANPRYLLLVPLVLNEEVFGVLELASFHEIQEHEIAFVERVAESTATALNILYSNNRKEQLLNETREQARELTKLDEQSRKNLQELRHIQEEAGKQANEFISFSSTVNHTLIRAEYNIDGVLEYANTRFLKKLGYSGNREVEGQHISMFLDDKDLEWFNTMWLKLAKGGAHFEGYMKHVTKLGQDLWTMATYTCIRKEDGEVDKVLFLGIDSTQQKEESLNYEGQIDAINKLSPKAEFAPDGRLIFWNGLFKRSFNYSNRDLEQMSVFEFVTPQEQERFGDIWEQVVQGIAFQGQLMMMGKFEEELWFKSTFTAVYDMYGEVEKIIFLAFDISKEMELEESLRNQNDVLKEKEEELRLRSLDLKKEMDDMKQKHDRSVEGVKLQLQHAGDINEQLSVPILSVNNQGYIRYLNKAAVKYFQVKKNEVLDHKVDVILHPEQDHTVIQLFVKPSTRVQKVVKNKVKLNLIQRGLIDAEISIFSSEVGSEVVHNLVIEP